MIWTKKGKESISKSNVIKCLLEKYNLCQKCQCPYKYQSTETHLAEGLTLKLWLANHKCRVVSKLSNIKTNKTFETGKNLSEELANFSSYFARVICRIATLTRTAAYCSGPMDFRAAESCNCHHSCWVLSRDLSCNSRSQHFHFAEQRNKLKQPHRINSSPFRVSDDLVVPFSQIGTQWHMEIRSIQPP
jgi:hypothetical protein